MTLLEVFNSYDEEDPDFDIRSNLGCWGAYCGAKLTKEGLEYYKAPLSYPCYWTEETLWVEEPTDTMDERSLVEEMLMAMAGYCSVSFFEQMFIL